ncbi:MAG: hypothetical protein HUU15_12430 [Candidatus Brocadiae bacterium]|nr:hypothetical protein [Candidatus Brocadiia bacterium]
MELNFATMMTMKRDFALGEAEKNLSWLVAKLEQIRDRFQRDPKDLRGQVFDLKMAESLIGTILGFDERIGGIDEALAVHRDIAKSEGA